MSIRSDSLRSRTFIGSEISRLIAEQLSLIDDCIRRSSVDEQNHVAKHTLPTFFAECGLTREDTQIYIYAALIDSLKSRGFGVKLYFGPPDYLKISWPAALDTKTRDACMATIQKAHAKE